jgi:hypothetical protein
MIASEHVIPDRTGSVVIVFWEDGTYDREPVLAWLIELSGDAGSFGFWPTPITYSAGEHTHYCVEVHEAGKPVAWIFAEENRFSDLESAINWGRENAIQARSYIRSMN